MIKNRFLKLSLGLLSFYPFFVFALIVLSQDNGDIDRVKSALVWSVIFLFPFQYIFYILNVFKNDTIKKNRRALWTYLIVFWNILAFPFYWYFHIWREPETSSVPEKT